MEPVDGYEIHSQSALRVVPSFWFRGWFRPDFSQYTRILAVQVGARYDAGGVDSYRCSRKIASEHCVSRGSSLFDNMNRSKSAGPFAIAAPPYYMPKPNPAVLEVLANGDKNSATPVDKPFQADVRATKGSPIYALHPYHTKVPPAGIEEFIRHYTQPGDVVLDPFSGSGMTGVAALALNRRALLIDLSPMATFIAYNYCRRLDPDAVEKAGQSVVRSIADARQFLYGTNCRTCGKPVEIEYIIWSDTYSCNKCGSESSFWLSATDESGKGQRNFPCPDCGHLLSRIRTTKTGTQPEAIAYRCAGCTGKKTVLVEWDELEQARLLKVEKALVKSSLWYPTSPIPSQLATRRTYWRHIERVDQFFESRELLALSELYEAIRAIPDQELRLRLLFIFTAILPHSSRMNRHKPTGTRSGVIYIPSVRRAVNPFVDFDKRLRRYGRHSPQHMASEHQLAVSCQSATDLDAIPDDSVDYIFTDPPFGGNLQYSELNMLWESWLGHMTDNSNEAVMNKHQRKKVDDYGNLITQAFTEACRVLKPGHWMTMVFHNSSEEVWQSIHTGLGSAGFEIASVRTFDKRIGTYNQVVGEGACGFDVTVNCRKPRSRKKSHETAVVTKTATKDQIVEMIHEALARAEKSEDRTARMLYSRMIGFCMEQGLKIDWSFESFRNLLSEEFGMRDGLWCEQ